MSGKGKRSRRAESEDIDFSPSCTDKIHVTFDFEDVRPDHFHAIRMLLQQSLIPGLNDALSDVADLCSSSKVQGTVITVEGDDEVFAFAAAINLTRNKVRRRIAPIPVSPR